MNRKLLKIIYLLIFSALFACQVEEDENAPAKGSITGKVRLADEFGHLLTDNGQVKVAISSIKEGYSIENGSYLIYGLNDGIYDLTYTKFGFGDYMRFGTPVQNFANTELTGSDTLGKMSTTLITGLTSVFDPSNQSWSFNCNVSPIPTIDDQRGIRLFFSKSDSVSVSNYEFTPTNKWLATSGSGSITGFDNAIFLNNGFSRNDSVYVVAYGESFYSNIYIHDVTGEKVFPNLNSAHPSNIVKFIIQ